MFNYTSNVTLWLQWSHHGGWWWTGACEAPGHLQPPRWHILPDTHPESPNAMWLNADNAEGVTICKILTNKLFKFNFCEAWLTCNIRFGGPVILRFCAKEDSMVYSAGSRLCRVIICFIRIVDEMYRQVSNIRRTKSQHLRNYRTVLRLSLPNPLKPDVKSSMKM